MEPLSKAVARVRAAARKVYDSRERLRLAVAACPFRGSGDERFARDLVTVGKRRKLTSWEDTHNAKFYLSQPNGDALLKWAAEVVALDDAFGAAWEEFEAARQAALALAFGADAPLFGLEWDAGFAAEAKP